MPLTNLKYLFVGCFIMNIHSGSIYIVFLNFYYREDRTQLGKLVESVKTNFNERADEVIIVLYSKLSV